MCNMGKGSTRDQHHSSQTKLTEEYCGLAQGMSRSMRTEEGLEGQSMAKELQGTDLLLGTSVWFHKNYSAVCPYTSASYLQDKAVNPHLPWNRYGTQRRKIFRKR